MDEKQLAKLIRKNAAKAKKVAKLRDGAAYDETLAVTRPADASEDDETIERDHFFKEMKRREF